MINVTHNGYDRRTWFHIFRRIIDIKLLFGFLFKIYEFNLKTEFACHQFNHLGIQTLIDRYHDTKTHTFTDDFGKAYIHKTGQVAYRNKFCQL